MKRTDYMLGKSNKPTLMVCENGFFRYEVDHQWRKQGTAILHGFGNLVINPNGDGHRSGHGKIVYKDDRAIWVSFGSLDEEDYSIVMGSGEIIGGNLPDIENYKPFFEGFGKRHRTKGEAIYIGVGYLRLK